MSLAEKYNALNTEERYLVQQVAQNPYFKIVLANEQLDIAQRLLDVPLDDKDRHYAESLILRTQHATISEVLDFLNDVLEASKAAQNETQTKPQE